jgi:hypothetical protein
MVAEALATKSFSTTGPAGNAARTARRILTSNQSNALNTVNHPAMTSSTRSIFETPSMLLVEANRLLQTAKVMHWLSNQQLLQTNPSGRFSSHSAWQGTVALRRTRAGSFPLLLTELIDAVTKHDVDTISYPPASPESFITTLFLSGNATTLDAFYSKLALLSYCLVDANFFKAPDLVNSVHRHFSIPRTTACGWMLLLFLDDAQLVAVDAPNNSSLNQAVNWLPGVNGLTIPFRALNVFVDRGRGDVALGLLRQRIQSSEKKETVPDIGAACTALRVRLANGLLAESFIELKRHLQSVPEGTTQKQQHAQRLIEELLQWGSSTSTNITNSTAMSDITRLSISPSHEEPALISWLQRSMHSMPSAGIILTLYFLMRGRTPEALLAYAQFGRQATAMAAGGAAAADGSSLEEACGHVEELLRAASRTMPAAQRALVVGTAAEPALRFSAEDHDMLAADGGVGGGGIALASALPGLDTGGLPTLLSVGPTPAEAPLVGSVMAGIARSTDLGLLQKRKDTQQGDEQRGASSSKEASLKSGKAVLPLLFGQTSAPGATTTTPLGAQHQFGAIQTAATGGGAGDGGLLTGRRQGHHQLDALLGITPRTQATGSKSRRILR